MKAAAARPPAPRLPKGKRRWRLAAGLVLLLYALYLVATGRIAPIGTDRAHLMMRFLGLAVFFAIGAIVALKSAKRRGPYGRFRGILHALALLGISGTLLFALLFSVEAGFFVVNRFAPGRIEVQGNPYDFRYSYLMGYEGRANTTLHGRCTEGSRLLYDVAYTLDAAGRRATPANADAEKAWLFFGGSFTYGEGVDDNEALPAQIALEKPDRAIYNYALPGYGTSQTLSRLQALPWRAEVPEEVEAAFHIFTPFHLRRDAGSMRIVAGWGRHFPCYSVGEEGSVQHEGTFERARPWRTRIYSLLGEEELMKHFNIDWPLRPTAADFQRSAALLHAAARALREHAPAAQFYVVLYPPHPMAQVQATDLIPYLNANEVKILDLSATWAVNDPCECYYLPGEGHPTAKAHSALAEALRRAMAPSAK